MSDSGTRSRVPFFKIVPSHLRWKLRLSIPGTLHRSLSCVGIYFRSVSSMPLVFFTFKLNFGKWTKPLWREENQAHRSARAENGNPCPSADLFTTRSFPVWAVKSRITSCLWFEFVCLPLKSNILRTFFLFFWSKVKWTKLGECF